MWHVSAYMMSVLFTQIVQVYVMFTFREDKNVS